jgi:hypothetical protein
MTHSAQQDNPSRYLQWAVDARSRNQRILLRLLELGRRRDSRLETDKDAREAYFFLSGSAFSLWRAAFLTDSTRTTRTILDDGRKLLERVVQDNVVAYPQDRDTREWMSGYYLNNASLRLQWVVKRLDVAQTPAEVQRVLGLDPAAIEHAPAARAWDILQAALERLVADLEVMLDVNVPTPRTAESNAD